MKALLGVLLAVAGGGAAWYAFRNATFGGSPSNFNFSGGIGSINNLAVEGVKDGPASLVSINDGGTRVKGGLF